MCWKGGNQGEKRLSPQAAGRTHPEGNGEPSCEEDGRRRRKRRKAARAVIYKRSNPEEENKAGGCGYKQDRVKVYVNNTKFNTYKST